MLDYLVDKGADISLKDNAGVSIRDRNLVNRFVIAVLVSGTYRGSCHISV